MVDRDERFAEQPCQVAAVVPQGSREEGKWTASEWLSRGVCLTTLSLRGASFEMLTEMNRMSERWPNLRSMPWQRRRRRFKMQNGSPSLSSRERQRYVYEKLWWEWC